MVKKLRPPFKIFGGKYYLSSWVLKFFPDDHEKYCEPFCGGASVFLNKTKAKEEIISDLDQGVIDIFKAIRDEPDEFIGKLKKLKYNENTFKKAVNKDQVDDYIDKAVNEFVLRRMSRGGLKNNFGWSERQRGGQPGDVNAWQTILKELPIISARLQNAVILNCDYKEILKAWDGQNVLLYLDPPYLPTTRYSKSVYEYEMPDHTELLSHVLKSRSKVLLSGYDSEVYNETLQGWKKVSKEVPNCSSQQKKLSRRIECLWYNY